MKDFLKVANTHAERLKYALDKLDCYFPMTREKVESISDDDMPIFDMFTNRFSKLQDYVGDKLFKEVLKIKGEFKEEMSFVDCLQKPGKTKCRRKQCHVEINAGIKKSLST